MLHHFICPHTLSAMRSRACTLLDQVDATSNSELTIMSLGEILPGGRAGRKGDKKGGKRTEKKTETTTEEKGVVSGGRNKRMVRES